MQVSSHMHALANLHLHKERLYPLKKKHGCAPELVWTLWRGVNSFFVSRIEPRIILLVD